MDDTAVLRRFNRTWSQRVGVLDESFLGLGVPLGVARLAFEIGADQPSVLDLRRRLGLDSGHLARLLRRLEADGLAEVAPDPDDRRRRRVRLTPAGRAFTQRLEDRSEELAARLVSPLTARQRARLTEALATADLLVRAATVELRAVEPDDPQAVEAVARYVAELDARFPAGFDPGPPSYDDLRAAQGGLFVLATSDGEPVACGGLRDLGDGVAEVKRMWVDDAWRGAGLGARLLRHLERQARERGAAVVRLDTHGSLVEAVAMYERAGYRRVERYNDNPYAQAFFEKGLTSGSS